MDNPFSNPTAHRWPALLERFGPLAALLILIAGTAIVEAILVKPGDRAFLSARNFANILGQGSYVGIVAVGMTFVILLGGIDLSVGSMVGLAAGIAIFALNALAPSLGDPAAIALAVLTCIAAGAALGLANGLLIARGRIAPFIATLGTMAIFRSLLMIPAQGGEIRSDVARFGSLGQTAVSFRWPLGGGEFTIRLAVVVFLAAAVLADLLLKRSVFGRQVFAIGDNPRAARYAGINTPRITAAVYAIAGFTCGLAAFLNASRLNSVSSATMGQYYELDAIAAVVIGGTRLQGGAGRVFGTVVGVLILGVANNMLNMLQVSTHYQNLVKGLIIIAAVLVQPRKALD